MPDDAISVVITVRDDRAGLAQALAALERQDRPADEIVVVDGGSTDGTREIAEYWRARGLPLRWIEAPGAGISEGRNRGIEAASAERVAITDAGCRPEPQWLAELEGLLRDHGFVAGTYAVDRATPLEHAVAVSLYPVQDEDAGGPLVRAWHKVFRRRVTAEAATGRSMAFVRDAWRAAGGFPEAVNAGEDLAFSRAVLRTGTPHGVAWRARVGWRGRRTWRENARMYFRYAQGDALMGQHGRTSLRIAAWVLVAAIACQGRAGRAGAAGYVMLYSSVPLWRAHATMLSPVHWWRIPAAIVLKDAAMMAGTVSGWRGHGLIDPAGEPPSAA